MFTAKKKSSPSKTNVTKLYTLSEACLTKQKSNQNILAKHEDWGIRLATIQSEIAIIKSSLQAKEKDLTVLDNMYQDINKKLKAIVKEVQKSQKSFSKKREDIQTKILDKVNSVDNSNPILLEALKANCKKIQENVEQHKQLLSMDVKKVEECDQVLKPIGQKLAKLLLPKNVEFCADESNDLKERLEAIIQSTSDMTVDEVPAQFNGSNMKSALTLLRDRCSTHLKLLDIVNANVQKIFPDVDNKEKDRKSNEKMEAKAN